MELVIVLSKKNMYKYAGEVLGYTLGNRRLTQTNKKQIYMMTHLKLSSIIRKFRVFLAHLASFVPQKSKTSEISSAKLYWQL